MKPNIVISILVALVMMGGVIGIGVTRISDTACPTHRPPQDDLEDIGLYFGPLTADAIQWAKQYDLVVLHPSFNRMTRATIAEIQQGCDPDDPTDDVRVLAHVTIGEDLRTVGLTDQEMLLDPAFVGDASGPRRDPRPTSTEPLPQDNFLGLPSNGGTQFASFYLDDISIANSSIGIGDGLPDRQGISKAAFTNPGDEAWFQTLKTLRYDMDYRVSGLDEIYTTQYGRGLGFDGFFIDMVDMASPNSWTSNHDPTQTKYEWVAAGVREFFRRLRESYPDSIIMQNRGLFFFNPRYPQFSFSTRDYIDYLMIECYRSCSVGEVNNTFYADNRFGYLPYLWIEANRPDGFKIASLGFNTGLEVPEATLLGRKTSRVDLMREDVFAATSVGLLPFVTNRNISLLNNFAKNILHQEDTQAPTWISLVNPLVYSGDMLVSPSLRRGIQRATPTLGGVIVQWDVAADLHGVDYVLSYQTEPFDFASQSPFQNAERMTLTPRLNRFFEEHGYSEDVYPYETLISGLEPNTLYHFHIQAVDRSSNHNGDDNQTVISVQTN